MGLPVACATFAPAVPALPNSSERAVWSSPSGTPARSGAAVDSGFCSAPVSGGAPRASCSALVVRSLGAFPLSSPCHQRICVSASSVVSLTCGSGGRHSSTAFATSSIWCPCASASSSASSSACTAAPSSALHSSCALHCAALHFSLRSTSFSLRSLGLSSASCWVAVKRFAAPLTIHTLLCALSLVFRFVRSVCSVVIAATSALVGVYTPFALSPSCFPMVVLLPNALWIGNVSTTTVCFSAAVTPVKCVSCF